MRLIPLFFVLLFLPLAFAHEDADDRTIDQVIRDNSIFLVTYGTLAIIIIIAASFIMHESHHHWPFFITAAIIVSVTGYLSIATISLNMISETKGPVHWHADFEAYKCGEKLNLIDPKGLSNKIGTPVFHEHNDDRMHVEGVVVEKGHVSLGEFIETVGGKLEKGYFELPTNTGNVAARDFEYCDENEGMLQVFLYRVTNPDPTKKSGFIYELVKLEDYENYVLSPYFNVPPGDCIIIEFDKPKETTERICETYRIAIEKGELSGR